MPSVSHFTAELYPVFLHRRGPITRVSSDHATLIGKRSADMTPRQVKWQTMVNQGLPDVCHVPGKDNPAERRSEIAMQIVEYSHRQHE